MRHFAVTRTIAAPPERVWSILTDPVRLADGSSGILDLQGNIAEAETIRLTSQVDPNRAFAIDVALLRPPHRMIWQSGLPLGLFTGRRHFTLTPVDEGTAFAMREEYSGPLAGLMVRFIPDLSPSFETFAAGLAAAAEGTAT